MTLTVTVISGIVLRGGKHHRGLTSVDLVVAALGVASGVFVVAGIDGPARVLTGGLASLAVPGWTIVRWFRTRLDRPLAIGLSVGVSVALTAVASSLMLAASVWNANLLIVSLCVLGTASTLIPVERGSTSAGLSQLTASLRSITSRSGVTPLRSRQGLILIATLALAMTLWLISLRPVIPETLGEYGLLPVYSPLWYVAVATVVCVWAFAFICKFPRVLAVALGVFTLILYATTAFVEPAPRLPYVYKHVAVTKLFELTGGLHPNVDIYNRWPGFFAYSAVFDAWTGLSDPLSYAAFAEFAFAIANAVLVFMLARSFTRSARIALLAASVFTSANWVGQGYYSPQALAYAMYLLLAVLLVRFLRGKPIGIAIKFEHALARVVRRRSQSEAVIVCSPNDLSRVNPRGSTLVANIAAVLVLQCAIVIAHQLTPYMVVVGFLPLAFFGYVRPRILGFVLLAMNLLFLLPNLSYVQAHFGLSSGFNFFKNATTSLRSFGSATVGNEIQSRVVIALTCVIILLALLGFIARARSGGIQSVVMVGWLSCAPLIILLGQNYGGEGRLRAVLFGLPWWSIGVAWLAQSVSWRSTRTRIWFGITVTLVTSMFVFAWLQPEADKAIAKADIDAAKWIDAHVSAQDQVVGAVPQHPLFPLTIDSHYPLVFQSQEKAYSITKAIEDPSPARKLAGVKKSLSQLSAGATIYVVFSQGDVKSAFLHRAAGYEALATFESDLRLLPGVRVVFDNGGARIYGFTGGA